MNTRLKSIFVTPLAVLTILFVLEIISRTVLKNIYNRSFDSSLIVDNKYFTSSGLKENAEGIVWGKNFHTDQFGCRKNSLPFNPKKKKWLFIGDSVTEGVGVDDSATFSSITAKEITDFNVLNYSLIGYSSSDYCNLISSLTNNDSTVQLVTLFYTLNDVYGKSKTKDLPVMAKSNFIHHANDFLLQHYSTYKLIKLFWFQNSDSYFRYDRQFYKKDDEHFQKTMNDLLVCDSICKTKNIFFSVVMLPYKSQLAGQNKTNRAPQQLVKQFCETASINFFNAAEFLEKKNNPESLYLFADEIHFSNYGHAEIAAFMIQ